MTAPVVGREPETRVITEFLDSAALVPAGLLIEGEPGIGKTTLWQAAAESAAAHGFTVLSTRPSAAEAVLAYSALADMVGGVSDAACANLPEPQRVAMDRVLLRAGDRDSVTDPRAVAAGFLSIVKLLQESAPVLLAVDDMQWLDSSSSGVMAFAARRLAGRVGIITTLRTEPSGEVPAHSLDLPGSAQIRRIRLGPLTLGGLRAVVTARLGQALPRAAAVRIHEVSQGNPFYALELARVMDASQPKSDVHLPGSLAELVRTRIGSLATDVLHGLLAAACASAPTVDLIARATGRDPAQTFGLLGVAEDNGIVKIDGQRVSFTHPILARGVYAQATPTARREMHRMLADIVAEPELQARHLAMSVGWADPETLARLDAAAELARKRGAPAAAAELLDLAVELGGDTPQRRIQLAGNHFEAGDSERARALLEPIVADLEPEPLRAVALSLLGSVRAFDDSFTDGVELWKRAAAAAAGIPTLRVPTLVILALTQFSTGRLAEGVPTADEAVADATTLGDPQLLSQALGVRVLIRFLRGEGIDRKEIQRALELEKLPSTVEAAPGLQMVLRPSLQHGLVLAWACDFDRAHHQLKEVRQLCAAHGHEFEWMYVAYYSAQSEIWSGNFVEANAIADEAATRAEQIGGDVATGAALTIRAALAAYAGAMEQARCDAAAAVAMHQRCGARMLAEWPMTLLGFLELSAGQYDSALTALQPLLDRYADGQFGMEIHVAAFMPEAIEAMVHLGRLDDAEPLVDALERNGRRLDRAWMLAVGGRCRGMLLAARGDVEAALAAGESAIAEHDRLPMPFERARTELFAGQLHRRRGYRDAATRLLRTALETFERLGTPIWADRARAELARADMSSRGSSGLTPSEQQVAELAASGMKNRDVAAALFISPKTVEANLARIYRKLGIHSRAELGRLMAGEDDV